MLTLGFGKYFIDLLTWKLEKKIFEFESKLEQIYIDNIKFTHSIKLEKFRLLI